MCFVVRNSRGLFLFKINLDFSRVIFKWCKFYEMFERIEILIIVYENIFISWYVVTSSFLSSTSSLYERDTKFTSKNLIKNRN